MINKPVVYKFSKTLLTTERRLTGQYLLGVKISPIFLNRRTTNDNFQHSGKQDYFRHILKRPASMYEKPGSWFFRITTGIQSRPRAIDKARFVMTSLTILGSYKELCSYRLVLEGKAGKEIPECSRLELLEKFLAHKFVSLDADHNTSSQLNRAGTADLPFLRTLLTILQISWEPRF